VHSFRRHILRHRLLAAWLIAAALLLKIMVPAGFMPSFSGGAITVALCAGQDGQTIAMELPGRTGDHDGQHHGKADMPCAFSGLSAPVLGAVDPILLATAIAFIIAAGFHRAVRTATATPAFLRPPSQGPPHTA
jgi:hypothetical protein